MTAEPLPTFFPRAVDVDRADRPRRFVSIVVPCMNEELVIGEFVDWCRKGLSDAGIEGEILIVDSSTDRSPEIAEAHGARVLRVPKRGLGQAYIDAIPHIRGDYIIMGDADLTYDFRQIEPFVRKLDEGCEFVMGTRMKGSIEAGAMPALHRYFGTPLTTAILNRLYGTRYTDIHCGMRAMTRDALCRVNLQSPSWEYASEMVLKAARLRLKTSEIPINFYKDREGRQSHHKRSGWFSPWKAGWINLRAMLVFAPDHLLFWPSLIMSALGLLIVIGLSGGPVQVGPMLLNLHAMLLGLTLATLGHSALFLTLLAKVSFDFQPDVSGRIIRAFSYTRGMILGGSLMAVGAMCEASLVWHWISQGLRLERFSHTSVFGLWLMVLGFQFICHTLIVQMLVLSRDNIKSKRAGA